MNATTWIQVLEPHMEARDVWMARMVCVAWKRFVDGKERVWRRLCLAMGKQRRAKGEESWRDAFMKLRGNRDKRVLWMVLGQSSLWDECAQIRGEDLSEALSEYGAFLKRGRARRIMQFLFGLNHLSLSTSVHDLLKRYYIPLPLPDVASRLAFRMGCKERVDIYYDAEYIRKLLPVLHEGGSLSHSWTRPTIAELARDEPWLSCLSIGKPGDPSKKWRKTWARY